MEDGNLALHGLPCIGPSAILRCTFCHNFWLNQWSVFLLLWQYILLTAKWSRQWWCFLDLTRACFPFIWFSMYLCLFFLTTLPDQFYVNQFYIPNSQTDILSISFSPRPSHTGFLELGCSPDSQEPVILGLTLHHALDGLLGLVASLPASHHHFAEACPLNSSLSYEKLWKESLCVWKYFLQADSGTWVCVKMTH